MNNENNVAEQSAVEPETTQTNSPQVEVLSTEAQTTQGQATQVESTDSTQSEEERREFQIKRLAEENRKLKDEMKARAQNESAFDAFRPTNVPQTGVQIEQFVDPATETVNWQAYNQAINYQAQQTAQVAAQQATAELLDEQQARTKHSDLFADPEIEQEMADRWIAARLRGENKSISQIADSVARKYGKVSSTAEKKAVEKVLEEVTEKEQASLVAPSQTSAPARQAANQSDLEGLRDQSRHGNYDAVAARMRSIPWANK